MSLPAGTLVRSPYQYLIVKPDGRLESLRYGDTVWYECDHPMPSWPSLEAWIESEKVQWWQLNFKGGEGIEPIVATYGLARAPDQEEGVHLYGTPGSPARMTAEQLLRRMEPSKAKWHIMPTGLKTRQEKQDYIRLWARYLGSFRPGPPPPHLPSRPVEQEEQGS
jgi:hypothetical protein